MSGRIVQCHRYSDGLCPGGPCEKCKYDAVNEWNAMVKQRDSALGQNIFLKLIIICEVAVIFLVAVRA